ncbi:transposase (plasmid) [Vibrio sp. ED002]|nr:transposase [Vibrio sp. ED002]
MRSRHFNDLGEMARLRNRCFLCASYLHWNCHVHASATRGGICQRTGLWKPIYFKAKVTEACWRAAITQLLSAHYSELDLSAADCLFIRHEKNWFAFLRSQYRWRWKLHFGKKTDQQYKTVNYLGRYLKQAPISGSRCTTTAKALS